MKRRLLPCPTQFQARDHAPLVRPTLRGAAELVDQALLRARASVLVVQGQLRVVDHRFELRVARQADDAVHIQALAPVDDALAAEPRVASEDDAHLGPDLDTRLGAAGAPAA